MHRPSKRTRFAEEGPSRIVRAAPRPITKELKVISKAAVVGAQVSTQLFLASFPGTMVGLRWDLVFNCVGAADTNAVWAVVILRENTVLGNLSLTDGSDLYTPEQNVIVWGAYGATAGAQTGQREVGETKSMRKLQGGDQLVFIMLGTAVNATDVVGGIQFFIKT